MRADAKPTRDEMIARAAALVPELRERAADAEALGRLPDETERSFHDAGLFRMLQPARIGGAELDYGILVDVGAEIARGCVSSAWNLTNLASHHWMLAMFPHQVQDEIWGGSPDTLIASSFVFPAGRATPADGGYRLSGRWPISSGVDNSGWNMLAGVVTPGRNEEESSEYRVFLLPRDDYQIHDNWDAAGLRATGSKDVSADDAFVPEHRAVAVSDLKNGVKAGDSRHDGAVFRLPVFAAFPYVLSGAALGAAAGAWETYVEGTRSRVASYSGLNVADFQTIQIKVARAAALIEAARLMMRADCARLMSDAEAGIVADAETRVAYRRNGAFAVGLCTEAVDIIFAASGGGAIYNRNPLQRYFRDAHAVNAHIAFNFDAAGASYGRVALGHHSDNPLL